MRNSAGDADEWRASREEAEAVLARVLTEAPELESDLYVMTVELETSLN